MMCAGTQGQAGMGFDAKGGDTCGLLRLLLRHQRLEEASQLVVHCLTLERDGELQALGPLLARCALKSLGSLPQGCPSCRASPGA